VFRIAGHWEGENGSRRRRGMNRGRSGLMLDDSERGGGGLLGPVTARVVKEREGWGHDRWSIFWRDRGGKEGS